ncbi:hypothetical protein DAERI_180036 [Deinococcus aerius]|uniref:Uncharacterized protein n=1 Tax=Deinococcus aerius TaxID=200253 RepID=A0A2I9E275_9DEIO|nr:hypothetical protein DAERI_180036 [Deinococcus aerius]
MKGYGAGIAQHEAHGHGLILRCIERHDKLTQNARGMRDPGPEKDQAQQRSPHGLILPEDFGKRVRG